MADLAGALERAVIDGFTAQARQHGAELHKRAVENRLNDPKVRELLATFAKQVKLYGARAQDFAYAGDHLNAVVWAQATLRAADNLDRLNAAVYS